MYSNEKDVDDKLAILGTPTQRDVRQTGTANHADRLAPESAPPIKQTKGSSEIDPFDPRNFKKAQDPRLNPGADPATSGLPSSIEARKPKKTWFFRVHPDPDYRAVLPLYTDEDSKHRDESYLFAPGLDIPPDLEDVVRDTHVAAAITSTGIPFLYKLAVSDSSYYESGLEVIRRAIEGWIRVTPADGCYVIHPPIAQLDEPHFPNVLFRDYLERAFRKRLIKSLDEPLVKKIRGAR
jgi:hypothetical protein